MQTVPPPANLHSLAEWLKVLAEPKRLMIVNLLMQGVQCNCELGEQLQMAPNLISHHLSVLRQAGLIDMERDALDGRWIYYSMNRLALTELTTVFGAFFDPARIQPRPRTCGPQSTAVRIEAIGIAGASFLPNSSTGIEPFDGGCIAMTDTMTFFEQGSGTSATSATVEFFDPPMCCPTGLCGPALDQTLLDVNDMILKLKAQGVSVERYQMTSHPQRFTSNAEVMRLVREQQMAALPICVIHGRVLKAGAYPALAEVAAALAEDPV